MTYRTQESTILTIKVSLRRIQLRNSQMKQILFHLSAGNLSLWSWDAPPFWNINMFTNEEAPLNLIVQSFYGSFIT